MNDINGDANSCTIKSSIFTNALQRMRSSKSTTNTNEFEGNSELVESNETITLYDASMILMNEVRTLYILGLD